MRHRVLAFCYASTAAGLLAACDDQRPLEPYRGPVAPQRGGVKNATTFATLTTLPALARGVNAEAYAVNRAGSIIAGYSRDRTDRMNPVTWTQQNGAWAITALPYPASATSAVARAVNDAGDVAGNDFPASTPHALLWPAAGGYDLLGCGELGEVFGMSAGGRVVVGVDRHAAPAIAALWQPGHCREDLPPLFAGGSASALAVNVDGTIVGGIAQPDAQSNFLVPVRWRLVTGSWQIDQLDSRAGNVFGANGAGDLTGTVSVSCASASTCNRGVIWYAAGGSRELGTLGGESTTPRAINAAGEVVGLSTLTNGDGVPFFWSEAAGMRQLPVSSGGWASSVSDVRADDTRLVAGAGGRPFAALAWVVRDP